MITQEQKEIIEILFNIELERLEVLKKSNIDNFEKFKSMYYQAYTTRQTMEFYFNKINKH